MLTIDNWLVQVFAPMLAAHGIKVDMQNMDQNDATDAMLACECYSCCTASAARSEVCLLCALVFLGPLVLQRVLVLPTVDRQALSVILAFLGWLPLQALMWLSLPWRPRGKRQQQEFFHGLSVHHCMWDGK